MDGVRVFPGMFMIVGMGGLRLTLSGGVVQGRCLKGGSGGGGGEQEGESSKPKRELHST